MYDEFEDCEFEDLDGTEEGTIFRNGTEIATIFMVVDSEDDFGHEVIFTETGDDSLYYDAVMPDELDLIQDIAAHLGCDELEITIEF